MFFPPFCPNPSCPCHHAGCQPARWYYRRGSYHTGAFGSVPRFTCRACGCSFSRQTFRLDYHVKKPVCYHFLKDALKRGGGLRSIARDLGISHQAVANRIGRLARQGLALHAETLGSPRFHLREDLAADGFESFVADQWQPNNIHLLVGTLSQCLYEFDYAHLRRKGRMTDEQKRQRSLREKKYIRARVSISESFTRLLKCAIRHIENRAASHVLLFTDEKQEYRLLVDSDEYLQHLRRREQFAHICISSKLPRTTANLLFPVNYKNVNVIYVIFHEFTFPYVFYMN